MRAQIRGLNRASTNSLDGISLVQSAEGALQEVSAVLLRMRELAIQGANDVNEASDRQALQDEVNQLIRELDRIANTTEFNKKTLLDGSLSHGNYIKSVSGFNVSSLSINTHFTGDAGEMLSTIQNSLTAIAVTTAGIRYDQTWDFSLAAVCTEDPPGLQNGRTTDAVAGSLLTITLTGDSTINLSTGIGDGTEDHVIAVAINAGETGAIIAGNVRDALSITLGADWTVTAIGSKLNVQHKYVGYFEEAIAIELHSENYEELFAIGATEWEAGAGMVGTDGQDVEISINGGEANDENEVVFEEDMDFIFADVSTGGESTIALRGRDSVALLRVQNGDVGDDDRTVAFSFKIDDATRLSGAIISVDRGNELSLQVGANAGYSQTIRLNVGAMSATALGVSMLDIRSHIDAQNAIGAVDNAIQIVNDQRALLGAVQNRLEHTIANLDTVAENLQDAESRIRDTDMAREMMGFTKFSILMQAAQAMMAQANSLPQGVLQLLR
jgi:flagellin